MDYTYVSPKHILVMRDEINCVEQFLEQVTKSKYGPNVEALVAFATEYLQVSEETHDKNGIHNKVWIEQMNLFMYHMGTGLALQHFTGPAKMLMTSLQVSIKHIREYRRIVTEDS
jgi:hypothetical protein